MTPPLLRWRIAGLRVDDAAIDDGDSDGDWDIAVVGDRIVLRGRPPTADTVPVGARGCSPGAARHPRLDRRSTGSAHGPRATSTGDPRTPTVSSTCSARATPAACASSTSPASSIGRLPEVGEALARRRADPGELDPTRILQLPTVQRIADDADRTTLLAALVADVCATGVRRAVRTSLAARLDPDVGRRTSSTPCTARRCSTARLANPDALGESSILQLAEHFGGADAVDAAHELAAARLDDDDWRRKELDEIRDRLLTALSHPELLDGASDARRHPPPSRDRSTLGAGVDRRPSATGEGVTDVPRVPRPGGARPSGVAGRRAATPRRRPRRRRRARRSRDVSHRRVVPRPPRTARPADRRDRRRRPRRRRRLADDVAGRRGARLVRRARRARVPMPAG